MERVELKLNKLERKIENNEWNFREFELSQNLRYLDFKNKVERIENDVHWRFQSTLEEKSKEFSSAISKIEKESLQKIKSLVSNEESKFDKSFKNKTEQFYKEISNTPASIHQINAITDSINNNIKSNLDIQEEKINQLNSKIDTTITILTFVNIGLIALLLNKK